MTATAALQALYDVLTARAAQAMTEANVPGAHSITVGAALGRYQAFSTAASDVLTLMVDANVLPIGV